MPSSVLFFLCAIASVFGKPPSDAKSREEIGHFPHDASLHDTSFDHEAFLGSQRMEEFSQLTREQSAERLKQIIQKIDKNGDGKITEDEMNKWISLVAADSQKRITEKRWPEVNPTNVEPLPWKLYLENAYGKDIFSDSRAEEYKRVVLQDRRRWESADQNKDDALTKKEFEDFLHPDDKPHMLDSLVDEMLLNADTDKDGKLTVEEYLRDVGRVYEEPFESGKPEPEWVERERQQYNLYRDLDKDGFMDRKEVAEWVTPSDYDAIAAETQHLFYHADKNEDGFLTEEEILKQQDLFVNSQATNYGETLESHQEL